MQCSGPVSPLLREPLVELGRLLRRVGIRDDDGVERRALFVVGLDAREIRVDQRGARQALRFERRVDVCDGRFDDVEGRRRLGAS